MLPYGTSHTHTGNAPMDLNRPRPPRGPTMGFLSAEELAEWAVATFVDPGGPVANEDHGHLNGAHLGALWAFEGARRQMRRIIATAEIPSFRGAPWVKARQEHQMRQWFGAVPDFVLTFDAEYAEEADDATWCALVEHELYHCAQATDQWGAPRFRRDGSPLYAIRGHDVEEFVGVVRRYGAGAAGPDVAAMVRAAQVAPTVASADIAAGCGTCRLAA